MNFEVKDLTGLGQPLAKLIEVISSGIGVIYRPRAIRKDAEAQAYALKVIGEAGAIVETNKLIAIAEVQAKSAVIAADANVQLEERVKQRQIYKETQRQINLEAIADSAAEQLAEEVSTIPVDENWRNRFFDIAQDISTSDMQRLWGKILAGEVAKPGTYSLRALEVMKNLSQKEAEIFQRARYLAINTGAVLKLSDGTSDSLERFGLYFDDILTLREAGLMLDGDTLSIRVRIPPGQRFIVLGYNGLGLLFEPKNNQEILSFSQYALSNVGVELLSLIDPQPNHDYLQALASEVATREGCDLSIGTPGWPRDSFKKLV